MNNTDSEIALEQAQREYAERNPNSFAKYLKACAVFPGGNTRSSLYYEPFPLTMVRGEGINLWDADGHKYVDFLGEYTAGLFGHSNSAIRNAIHQALDCGIDLGAHSDLEARLGLLICARFASIELVRFTNSGTEANLMAVSAARAITKRSKILVFDGAYHGAVFSFASGGNPINAPFEFLVAKYNDLDRTMALFHENADDLAAVLLEAMIGIGGCIPVERAFLKGLRDETSKHGVFLIFDEVMTSRLSRGGLQEVYGVNPDITTLGKYVGGGMTFGAFGGRAEIMKFFDPRKSGAFPHAGTFNNNVVSMAAGIAGMSLYTSEVARQHNARGDRLRDRLNTITGMGSMLNIHMRRDAIHSPSDVAKADPSLRELFFLDLVALGFWLGRSGMIVLSLPTTDEDCDHLAAAVERVIDTRRSLITG